MLMMKMTVAMLLLLLLLPLIVLEQQAYPVYIPSLHTQSTSSIGSSSTGGLDTTKQSGAL
jgi:hypothetical protein